MTDLNLVITEGSTLVVYATFTDDQGNAVIPNSNVLWYLLDRKSNTVSNGSVSVSGSTVTVAISGNDLSCGSTRRGYHVMRLVLRSTYNSDAGSNLDVANVAVFTIYNP